MLTMVIFLNWMEPIPLPKKYNFEECNKLKTEMIVAWKKKSNTPITVKCINGYVKDSVKDAIELND